MTLRRFEARDAPSVVGWIESVAEAARWASIDTLPTNRLLARWHAADDVVPFVWLEREPAEPVAYGEIWEDRDEDEAELARIVVAPAMRGQGIGRRFVRALASEARSRGFAEIWLRVVPENAPAIAAYEAAGFRRATAAEEAAFNAGQPTEYRWFRDATADRSEGVGGPGG